jgi:hypothetical protein
MLKHIKLYEEFDLDAFMSNPEEYFHNDESDEIELGDYVTSYRGIGQVISMDSDFIKLQLIDGPKSVVKVPSDMAKKIKKTEAMEIASKLPSTQNELKSLSDELANYIEVITTTNDDDTETISGNLTSSVDYLEEILIDVISLTQKDTYTTYYREYADLVSGIASLAHSIIEKSADDSLKNRVDVILDKFYEISN